MKDWGENHRNDAVSFINSVPLESLPQTLLITTRIEAGRVVCPALARTTIMEIRRDGRRGNPKRLQDQKREKRKCLIINDIMREITSAFVLLADCQEQYWSA